MGSYMYPIQLSVTPLLCFQYKTSLHHVYCKTNFSSRPIFLAEQVFLLCRGHCIDIYVPVHIIHVNTQIYVHRDDFVHRSSHRA